MEVLNLKLFEKKIRKDMKPSKNSDDKYDFLDRSGRKFSERIRNELNKWFSNLPKNEQNTMKRRFKTEFNSAFFELFLHELFIRMGYELTIHPDISESSNHPDFLVEKENIKFYLEATVNNDLSNEEQRQKAKVQAYYDEINKIDSPNCYLRLNEVKIPKKVQPAGRKIRSYLTRKLKNLDIESLISKFKNNGFNELPIWTYQDEDNVVVKITPIPKLNNSKEKSNDRPIGMYPIKTKWGGTVSSLYNSLVNKAGKYGDLNHPYIIAVNSLSDFGTEKYEIMNALFGDERYYFNTNGEPIHKDRKRNGFFYNSEEAQYTRVSGVIVTTVVSTNISNAPFYLYHNPWAGQPISQDCFDFTQYMPINGNMKEIKGQKIKDILKLPDNWPILEDGRIFS